MSDTPRSHIKSQGDSAPSVKKKDKGGKKSRQERSAVSTGAMDSIPEKADVQGSPGGEDGSEGSWEEEPTMKEMLSYLVSQQQQISVKLDAMDARIDRLEDAYTPQKNLKKSFETPLKKTKKHIPSSTLLQSVAASAVKKDWRQLEDEEDDGDEDPSSSDEDEDDDDARDREERSSEEQEEQPKARKKRQQLALFRKLDAVEAAATNTVINITRQEKECGVRIKDFVLSNLCIAMKRIIDFQVKEGTYTC